MIFVKSIGAFSNSDSFSIALMSLANLSRRLGTKLVIIPFSAFNSVNTMKFCSGGSLSVELFKLFRFSGRGTGSIPSGYANV